MTEMELETLNKLYLELSQVAEAKTEKEIELESRIQELELICNEYNFLLLDLEKKALPEELVDIQIKRRELWDKVWPCPF